jgi:phosphomannomutase
MATPKIVFGTDGWRGRIADSYTFSSVRRCTHGFAQFLLETNDTSQPVVVGHDRRFASENFAACAAEVLAGNGFAVLLTDGPSPTPTISYAVVDQKAIAAINITASHNPPSDNGFKVRDIHGGAVAPDGLKRIESLIPDSDEDIPRIPLKEAIASDRIQYFDPNPGYLDQLKKLVDLDPILKSPLNIMVDPMWGNGSGWLPKILSGGRITIKEIHQLRNPIFPEMTRPEPIPPNVDAGLAASLANNSDALVIFDGDADRFGLGDENGRFIDQLRVYGLLAYYMLEVRNERGPIVKTLSTTSMLDKLGKLYNVPVHETGVGFKYVAPKMLEVDALIGGEESGGYAFKGHVPERDGILAALYLLDMMVKLDATPFRLVELLFEKVGRHYYDRIDSPIPPGDRSEHEQRILDSYPNTIGGLKVTELVTKDGFKFCLEDGGWLLIRFSGTEPIVRVYCETTNEELVQPILDDGLRIVGLK